MLECFARDAMPVQRRENGDDRLHMQTVVVLGGDP
jgi:hypothetical protein